eukprot:ctg_2370.g562
MRERARLRVVIKRARLLRRALTLGDGVLERALSVNVQGRQVRAPIELHAFVADTPTGGWEEAFVTTVSFSGCRRVARGRRALCVRSQDCAEPPGVRGWRCTRRAVLQRALATFALSLISSAGASPAVADEAPPKTSSPVDASVNEDVSGLRFVDFVEGTGASPQWGDLCVIEYELYTLPRPKPGVPYQGALKRYATSHRRRREDSGYLLRHGNGRTIRGLELALHSMLEGGMRRVIIPPHLAYVGFDLGPIPEWTFARNALAKSLGSGNVLVMDVLLERVMKDPNMPPHYTDSEPDEEEIQRDIEEYYQEHTAKGEVPPEDDGGEAADDV